MFGPIHELFQINFKGISYVKWNYPPKGIEKKIQENQKNGRFKTTEGTPPTMPSGRGVPEGSQEKKTKINSIYT